MTVASGLGLLGCGMIVTMVFWFVLSKAFEYERRKLDERSVQKTICLGTSNGYQVSLFLWQ
jgi:transketolase C-terminal domain/subunit